METISLYTWQTLYKEDGREVWRTDPNHWEEFQECYDFGIDLLTDASDPNEITHRISVIVYNKESLVKLGVTPFFYLKKDVSNASNVL